MTKKLPKIFRLMTHFPYFSPGSDKKDASKKFGSGPFFKVSFSVLDLVVAISEENHYKIGSVIEKCRQVDLTPLFYIDETQDSDSQLECARRCIAAAAKYGLPRIGIFSPVSEFLDEVRKIDAGEVKIKTGRLAGHLNDWRTEIRQEAAKGTSAIVFYAYEHKEDEIKAMIRFADKHEIAIMFNVRDKVNYYRDVLTMVVLMLKMTAKGGGGILCNDPLTAKAVFEEGRAGK